MRMVGKRSAWWGMVATLLIVSLHDCYGEEYGRIVQIKPTKDPKDRRTEKLVIGVNYMSLDAERTGNILTSKDDLSKYTQEIVGEILGRSESSDAGKNDGEEVSKSFAESKAGKSGGLEFTPICVADFEVESEPWNQKRQIWRSIKKEGDEMLYMFVERLTEKGEKVEKEGEEVQHVAEALVRGIAADGIDIIDDRIVSFIKQPFENNKVWQSTARFPLREEVDKDHGIGMKLGWYVVKAEILGSYPLTDGLFTMKLREHKMGSEYTKSFLEASILEMNHKSTKVESLKQDTQILLAQVFSGSHVKGLQHLFRQFTGFKKQIGADTVGVVDASEKQHKKTHVVAEWVYQNLRVTYRDSKDVVMDESSGPHLSLLYHIISKLSHYALHYTGTKIPDLHTTATSTHKVQTGHAKFCFFPSKKSGTTSNVCLQIPEELVFEK